MALYCAHQTANMDANVLSSDEIRRHASPGGLTITHELPEIDFDDFRIGGFLDKRWLAWWSRGKYTLLDTIVVYRAESLHLCLPLYLVHAPR